MKLFYIANARIPTEKAHGLTIVKSCEAFARAGAEVTLVIPRRKTQFAGDIFETYHVDPIFTVRFVPVFDAIARSSSSFAFWLTSLQFYMQVVWMFLWMRKGDVVAYTRDPLPLLLSWVGVPTVLECHHVFSKQAMYYWLARCASRVITISRALKQKFVDVGFEPDDIAVFPSGVDLSIFSIDTTQSAARAELHLPTHSPIIAYTGNFTTMGEDKGISDILRVLRELSDVRFVAAGGSDKDRARYEQQARELEVADRVVLVGYGPQKNLALYQRAADILLMPFPDTPHYRSNMSPVKMFEYMASERPIIATNLPTIREVLNDTNAVIIPPGDTQALASAVRMLLTNPSQRETLSQQAKKDVTAYSWTERSRGVLSFIQKRGMAQ